MANLSQIVFAILNVKQCLKKKNFKSLWLFVSKDLLK